MYTNSNLLQAVISGAGDGTFYPLLPDKENPGCHGNKFKNKAFYIFLLFPFNFASLLHLNLFSYFRETF